MLARSLRRTQRVFPSARWASTFSSPLQAIEKGDFAAAKAAFPGYLKEYRETVVPEPELAHVSSGRFDKFLRLMGEDSDEDWGRFLAAALVDLRDKDPAICQTGVLVNSLIFAVLCEALPPRDMGRHLQAVQLEGAKLFETGEAPSPTNPMGGIDSMSPERREQAMAQDALFKAWYHGMFIGGRGTFDELLTSTRDKLTSQHRKALASIPESETEQRQQMEMSIGATEAMLFPGDDPAMRPPLTELPLLGIDVDFEEFATAIEKGHFYTFLSLSPNTADLAQKLIMMRLAARGEIPPSDAPSLVQVEGATYDRMARGAATLLSMYMLQPVLQALWVHAACVPDSPAVARIADIASRWSLHGKRTLVVRGNLPPALEKKALQTTVESATGAAWRLPSEIPTDQNSMTQLMNPLGLQAVALGPPADAVTPYETMWGAADHIEDMMSLAASRLAAHSFMANAVRMESTVSSFLAEEIQRLQAGLPKPEDGSELNPVQFFAEDPGRNVAPAVEQTMAVPTDEQRWAALTGVVAPGCLAAISTVNAQQKPQQERR